MRLTCSDALASRQALNRNSSDVSALVSCSVSLGGWSRSMDVHADYVWHAAHNETGFVTRDGTTGNAVRAWGLRHLVSRVDVSENVLD